MGICWAVWNKQHVTSANWKHLASDTKRAVTFQNHEHFFLSVMKMVWARNLTRGEYID